MEKPHEVTYRREDKQQPVVEPKPEPKQKPKEKENK